jgi:adenylosuccinate lyase
LKANPIIAGALPTEKLRALCDPANYLGSAPAMVDAIVRKPRGL